MTRPAARGKFLFAGDEKLYVRGVTYGTFRPNEHGEEYERVTVERDFAMMAQNGINTVRVYTPPPIWLLDVALRHGLRVMVGLPWEQHIAFLESRKVARSIVERVRQGVSACASHPAILCFSIGNEIPSSIVRWYGPARVEAFLRRLAMAVKQADPGALVTYVNFPPTEYLHLDFVDFVSFNVYLESPERLTAYLARLQNLAGDKPLLMAEIGLDSRRNGVDAQAQALDWQVRSVFEAGCAGAIVFSWTDEWHRGGHDIENWDFGLVDRDRIAKPALAAVHAAYQDVPFGEHRDWPTISVIVCSYNGSRTIANCLEGVRRLDYPDKEVIVVDDGSTDNVSDVAAAFDVRLIRTANQGLGAARNVGMQAATGEILAYIDDDARPDPHWLSYVADMYRRTDFVAVGGPNIAPDGDGLIAAAVAHAPGGPVHVLVTDTEADHIPGCNFSIRKSCLQAVGGWDPRFRAAGDDVDLCWRLQEQGWKLGYMSSAMVWHHRRNSVRTYWRQQQGYGKAEALLEDKWPERYNAIGHLRWTGRLYGKGLTQTVRSRRGRIYQGTWGTALFQSVYEPAPGLLASLPLMPEWWLVVPALAGLSLLGLWWAPLLLTVPLLLLTMLASVVQAVNGARQTTCTSEPYGTFDTLKLRVLTAFLHLIQPIARLRGRLRFGLTPWRSRHPSGWRLPLPVRTTIWSEEWHAPEAWLTAIETHLREGGTVVIRGGDFDRWDLAARGGLFGGTRLLMMIEEHGAGKQLVQYRCWPRVSGLSFAMASIALLLALGATIASSWAVAVILVLCAGAAAWGILRDCGASSAAIVPTTTASSGRLLTQNDGEGSKTHAHR
ncbi:MAG: glycosyltransferase [Chloroflexota bacterium]|nr:glycosyltransferase [Chloroflexota bacterium]